MDWLFQQPLHNVQMHISFAHRWFALNLRFKLTNLEVYAKGSSQLYIGHSRTGAWWANCICTYNCICICGKGGQFITHRRQQDWGLVGKLNLYLIFYMYLYLCMYLYMCKRGSLLFTSATTGLGPGEQKCKKILFGSTSSCWLEELASMQKIIFTFIFTFHSWIGSLAVSFRFNFSGAPHQFHF